VGQGEGARGAGPQVGCALRWWGAPAAWADQGRGQAAIGGERGGGAGPGYLAAQEVRGGGLGPARGRPREGGKKVSGPRERPARGLREVFFYLFFLPFILFENMF
jgi:hypothetical protein